MFIDLIRALVFYSTCITFKKIYLNFLSSGIDGLINPIGSRYNSGLLNDIAPALLVSIFVTMKIVKDKTYKVNNFILFLNFYGMYLMASRIDYLIAISFVISVLLFSNYKTKIKVASILIFFVISYGVVKSFSITTDSAFIDKSLNSLNEVNVLNYSTEEEINGNYRGYETFMALKEFNDGSITEIIFGGLGRLVDLEINVMGLQEGGMRYIPIFHNSYIYMLIKNGIAGILVFVILIYKTFYAGYKRYRLESNNSVATTHIYFGCLGSILVTSYFIPGFHSGELFFLQVMIGFLYKLFDYSNFSLYNERRSVLLSHNSNI
ncbi:hypothetical protein [Spirosoma pomorum]